MSQVQPEQSASSVLSSLLPRSARVAAAMAVFSLPALPKAACASIDDSPAIHRAEFPDRLSLDLSSIRAARTPVTLDADSSPQERSRVWSWASLVGTLLTGALGYLHYFARSLTPEERTSSALRRVLTAPFRNEPHSLANRTFLKISSLNHAAVLGLGIVAARESGQSLLALSAPAIFLAGTLACLGVSEPRPVNRWIRACEGLAVGAIGCLLATRIPVAAEWLSSLLGIRPVVLGIGAALLARTLAIAPLVLDAVNALKPAAERRGFPPLKNLILWNLASISALGAVEKFDSLAAVIPVGYVLQNTLCLGLILGCYARWRAQGAQGRQ